MLKVKKKTMILMEMTNDFVLLKELPRETKTESGILIALDKWGRRCTVVSSSEECQLNIGDTVLRNVGKGTSIELDGEEFEILHTDWIMGILNERKH